MFVSLQGSLGEYHYTVGSASMPVLDIQVLIGLLDCCINQSKVPNMTCWLFLKLTKVNNF